MSTINNNNQILPGNNFDLSNRRGQESQGTGGRTNGFSRGEIVTAVPSMKSIIEAMEELTVLGSEKAEKDLTKRKVKDGSIRVSEAHELVSEYLKKVPDLEKKQSIEDLATRMANDNNLSTIGQLQEYLKSFSEEKSHQYMALEAVKKFLGTDSKSIHLRALINQAILNFKQEPDSWAQIETEIRVSKLADDYSQENSFSSLHQLRGFYRDTVHSYQGLSAAYKDVVERFGEKEVPKAVDFMLQGMSADLSVQGSNIDSVKLQLLVSDMQKLKTLNTLLEQVSNLYQMFKPQQADYGLPSY